jgi:hypothetical protein
MATYVNNLRLKEIATGDESGTWGTSTNTNLELIADAFGSGTEAIVTNANTHTTTVADGSADEGRAIYMKYTGALDSNCTITLAPNTINKLWIIENATTDSASSGPYSIIISQGSGANITIGNSKVSAIFTDGAGSGAAVLDALADLELSATLTVTGAITGSSTVQGTTITATTAFVPDASDGAALGTTSLEFSDLYLADAAVIGLGDDQDVTLTHVHDTGLLLNSTRQLQFNDATQYIAGISNEILSINATAEIDLTATAVDLNGTLDVSGTSTLTGNVTMSADASVGNDLTLVSDASVLNFGVDSDVNLTHVADTALSLNKDLRIAADDEMLVLGAGQDATISYTGTHLIVQPQVAGSGQFVVSTNTGSYPSLNAATVAIIQRNAATGNDVMLDLLAGTAGDSILNFSDSGYQGAGAITYDHTTPHMAFGVGENTEWMRCDAATGRNVSIGCTDAEQQLQVKDATYGFQIESSAATKNPAIVYETTDGVRWVNGVNIAEGGTDAFEFRAAGSVFALRLAYDGGVVMPNLPTSNPNVAGELWNSSGDLKVSAGP